MLLFFSLLLIHALSKELCLKRSELVIGDDSGEAVDHYSDLQHLATEDTSLFKFKTCYDQTTKEVLGL